MMRTIRELIKERWIKVRIDGIISKSRKTDLEVPQGGVLRETLFLVAINDILNKLKNGVDGSLFADDLTIYTTIKNMSDNKSTTNDDKLEKMGYRESTKILHQKEQQ